MKKTLKALLAVGLAGNLLVSQAPVQAQELDFETVITRVEEAQEIKDATDIKNIELRYNAVAGVDVSNLIGEEFTNQNVTITGDMGINLDHENIENLSMDYQLGVDLTEIEALLTYLGEEVPQDNLVTNIHIKVVDKVVYYSQDGVNWAAQHLDGEFDDLEDEVNPVEGIESAITKEQRIALLEKHGSITINEEGNIVIGLKEGYNKDELFNDLDQILDFRGAIIEQNDGEAIDEEYVEGVYQFFKVLFTAFEEFAVVINAETYKEESVHLTYVLQRDAILPYLDEDLAVLQMFIPNSLSLKLDARIDSINQPVEVTVPENPVFTEKLEDMIDESGAYNDLDDAFEDFDNFDD